MDYLEKAETPSYKITVEEVNEEKYIGTLWYKEECLEADRIVAEFETRGGATGWAFRALFEIIQNRGAR